VNDGLSTVAALGAGGNTTGSGTTLELNGHNQTVGGLFSNGILHITNNSADTNSVLTLNTAADWSSDSTNNKTTIEDGVGQVSLVKSGTFKQTLAGTHTYTGNTTIKAGTLALTSTGSIAESAKIIVGDTGSSGAELDVTAKTAFAIGDSQTLAGIGTVNIGAGKTVTIEGTHAPGNSAGIQSITGNLSYATNSIFEWDLASGTLGTRGTDYDGVNVTGDLAGAGAVFKVVLGTGSFTDPFWNTTREWSGIFTASNTIDMASIFSNIQWWEGASEATVDNMTAPGHFSFTNSGTTLTWTAVPEPTSALAGILLGAGLLRRRRSAAAVSG
jgi:autotransporter-associated beta strand protein